MVFCWKTIIAIIQVISSLYASSSPPSLSRPCTPAQCRSLVVWVQSPNREIWDLGRAILPHLHVLGQCGAHLVKVNININTTSKLTNFGTYLATVNLNFNININVTSISWAGQWRTFCDKSIELNCCLLCVREAHVYTMITYITQFVQGGCCNYIQQYEHEYWLVITLSASWTCRSADVRPGTTGWEDRCESEYIL